MAPQEDPFERKRFDNPDDHVDFPNGGADVVTLGGTRVQQVTFEPDFRWTRDMPALAGAERCPIRHRLQILSGKLAVQLSDGSEHELGPGDLALLPPDHDSWTVGDDPVVFLDFDPTQ